MSGAVGAPFDFGGACLIGRCAMDQEVVAPTREHLGLRKAGSFLYGTWRDEEGNLLRAIRGLDADRAAFRFLFAANPGEQLLREPAAEEGLWVGPMATSAGGGSVRPSWREWLVATPAAD